ncbi:hypothetical protein F511_42251 [Dorcoceras hygrometricum]|uniref:Uncharacterized protein n=1 Tax=Dorcoceras hygrometricum TaxID=472368 RepID=A0A2Z7A0E3_9LAMI|nr:hypothetical protein F511_42251 [Dorcoceras hygrometricum]
MVADSIGICELKGPYYTLTMIDWFLQALSVIGDHGAMLLGAFVGAAADPDPFSRGASEAPGSDQIHRESGTSTVGGGRSPNPVHDWKQDSFVRSRQAAEARRQGGGGRERRGGEGWAALGG